MVFVFVQLTNRNENKRILWYAQLFTFFVSLYFCVLYFFHIYAYAGDVLRLFRVHFVFGYFVVFFIYRYKHVGIARQVFLYRVIDKPIQQRRTFVEVEAVGCVDYFCMCFVSGKPAAYSAYRGMAMDKGIMVRLHEL